MYYVVGQHDTWALLRMADSVPPIIGIACVVGVSSTVVSGMHNYAVTSGRTRMGVYWQILVGSAIAYIAVATFVYLLAVGTYIASTFFSNTSASLYAVTVVFLKYSVMCIFFVLVSTSLGMCATSVAGALSYYALVVWLLPIFLVIAGLVRDGLSEILSSWTVGVLVAQFMATESWNTLFLILAQLTVWILVVMFMAAWRFNRRYT